MVFHFRLAYTSSITALLLCAGCGGAPDRPGQIEAVDSQTRLGSSAAAPEDGVATEAECPEGEIARCVIRLPTQGSVHNCTWGFSLCSSGEWSDCIGESQLDALRSNDEAGVDAP
jgi:hypothetical protein